MKRIYLYVFEARPVRRAPGRRRSPPLFCILFLLQEENADRRLQAEQAIWRARLYDVRFADGPGNGKAIDYEASKVASYRRIAAWYAEALQKGICLVRNALDKSVL